MNEATGRVRELDGWRGLSIALVVFGHLINFRYSSLLLGQSASALAGALSIFGVNVFFVVSGYIITRLAINEKRLTGRFGVLRFYIRRTFRIFPAFFVYLGFLTVLSNAGVIVQPIGQTFRAALFSCNIFECGVFTGHSWSLAYEEQFYILFALVFAFLPATNKGAFLLLFIASALFPFFRYFLHLGQPWMALAQYLPTFCYISAGVLMAFHEKPITRIMSWRWGNALSMAAVAFVLLGVYWAANAAMGTWAAYLSKAANATLLPISVAWLIGTTVLKSSRVAGFLRLGLFQWLGAISYSLYLWQQLFTVGSAQYAPENWLRYPLLMIVFASLSYYLVERPFIGLGRKILSGGSLAEA